MFTKLLTALALVGLVLGIMAACGGPAPAPTPAPAPAPAPKPAPTPAPAPASKLAQTVTGDVPFEFVSVTDPAQAGGPVEVVAKTVPGAECTISMLYSDGAPSAITFRESPPTQIADAGGKVTWKGTLYRAPPAGKSELKVTIKTKDGKTGAAVTYFVIVR